MTNFDHICPLVSVYVASSLVMMLGTLPVPLAHALTAAEKARTADRHINATRWKSLVWASHDCTSKYLGSYFRLVF